MPEITQLTKAERHKVYVACLKELYRCQQNNELFFICPAIRNMVAPGAADVTQVVKDFGFNDLLKHKPTFFGYAWFGGLDYEPRIKILESLINETKE